MADAPSRPPHFWEELLQLIDEELDEPHTMVIVGGAAIGLRYDRKHVTTDIDSVASGGDRKLWAAVRRACKRMQERHGLEAPPRVSTSGVFDPPEDWERRQRRLRSPKLQHLVVMLPDRYDIAISKVSRGESRDHDAILAMHRGKPFRLNTFIKRYEETRRVYVGNVRLFKMRFLSMVAMLYGEAKADLVAPTLRED